MVYLWLFLVVTYGMHDNIHAATAVTVAWVACEWATKQIKDIHEMIKQSRAEIFQLRLELEQFEKGEWDEVDQRIQAIQVSARHARSQLVSERTKAHQPA